MKAVLAFACSVLCVGFALWWVALVLYAQGMGSFSGNYPWTLFDKFWVVAPVLFWIIGIVAVWFPLSTATKTTLFGGLIVLFKNVS